MKIRFLCCVLLSLIPASLAIAQSTVTYQSIQPNAVLAGSAATSVTLKGSGFSSSMLVTVKNSSATQFQVLTPIFVDNMTLQASIPASFLTKPDALIVQLDTPAPGTAPPPQWFYVYSSTAPGVSSIVPVGGFAGTTGLVQVTGTNLVGATLTFGGVGITAVAPSDGQSTTPTTSWIFQVTVAPGLPLGTQTLTVSTPAGSTGTCGATPCTFSIIQPGVWTDVSTSFLPRPAAAVRLLDGRVLVVGLVQGTLASPNPSSSAQIFDPTTNQWTGTGAPNTPRLSKTAAVLLPDGRVFVCSSDSLMAEIYDPTTGSWSYTSPMTTVTSGSAILLSSGQVLVQHSSTSPGADVFDPVSGAFQSIPIASGEMQLMSDGKVLIVNGDNNKLYDPTTGTMTSVPVVQLSNPLNTGYITRLLPDGRVLIQYGQSQQIHNVVLASSSAVIYDPQTNAVLPSAVTVGGGAPFHGTVVLPSGKVLVSEVLTPVNGPTGVQTSANVILYDPQTDQILPQTTANPPFNPDILLYDGRTFGFSFSVGLYTPAPYTVPAPVIGSVVRLNGEAGGPIPLDIRGTSFTPTSIVAAGGSSFVTLYLGAQHLIAFVPPALASTVNMGVTVTNPGPDSSSTPPVPVGFVQTLPITDVESGTIRTGYAIITPDSGTSTPISTLTYGIVHNAVVQSQAAILPTPLTTATSLPVDYIPSVGRNLGIAIANRNTSATSITLTIRDASGAVVASPVLSMAAGNQIARFVSELFPSGALGGAFAGNVTIESSVPVSVIGLRFSGQVFSTVPVTGTLSVPQQGAVGGPNAVMFPQFAMSGGWATTFELLNTTAGTISGRLDLFDPSGNPLQVTLNNITASTFTYSISPHGSFTFAPRDPSGLSPF